MAIRPFHPEDLRLVTYYDQKENKILFFITNNFHLVAATIAAIYKARWEIELFFKWIKQNFKDKNILGNFPERGPYPDLDGDDLLFASGLHQIPDQVRVCPAAL